MQLFLLFLSILLSTTATSQTIITNKGATIQLNDSSIMTINGTIENQSTGLWKMDSGSQLHLRGSILNNSLTNFTTGTGGSVIFNGSSLRTIGGSHSIRFYHLESAMIGTGSDLQLDTNVQIDGNLKMTSGNINLNGKMMSLSTTSTILNETNNRRIFGTSGFIRTTRPLNAPNNLNIGGLGLVLSSTTNLGNTTIERGHQQQNNLNGNISILRYYNIQPTSNSGLNASIELNYFDNELIGQNESDLQLSQSTNNGSSWTTLGGTIHSNNNYLALSGINAFDTRLTLIGPITNLPIESLNFQAVLVDQKTVRLDWSTTIELDNDYFEIQRSTDGIQFESINKIAGAGTSYDRQVYVDWDNTPPLGHVYYRLKQVDIDQTSSFSPIRHVYLKEADNNLLALYPNPLVLPKPLHLTVQKTGTYQITIYNGLGTIVFTKEWNNSSMNSSQQFQLPDLSAANYFYTIHHETSLVNQGKLILLPH